ncbi:MAG TPA: AAC(3) family N-acetyltransferase [Pseudonocardiaceae bacterium]|nr:AAC(3) family N-acetyltransferase [Pseudonocardiaceae bacterium]
MAGVSRSANTLDRAEIRSHLSMLGLPAGSIYLIHSSLRRVGPLVGGVATLADALRDVLGPQSTIVVPTFTARNSTTTRRFQRAVVGMTPEQIAAEEAKIEGFHRSSTPAQDVGAFAEFIRRHPEAVRSDHPQTSFTALGPSAAELTRDHALDCHLGERSPLAKLYAADAIVLLLGEGIEDVCTCFHLAEHRLSAPAPQRLFRCYVLEDGRRTLREFMAADVDDSDFDRLGAAMVTQAPFVRRSRVGQTTASWFQLRAAVDFAVVWMSRWRPGSAAEQIRADV